MKNKGPVETGLFCLPLKVNKEMEEPNPNKPKFKATIVAFTEQRRKRLAEIAAGPVVPREQNEVLEDYLHVSMKRRSSPISLFRLQINMIQDLIHLEKGIAKYKKDIEEREAKIKNALDDKEQIEKEISLIEREILKCKAECRAIRDIADGIVWRLFDYDRATLYEIANRSSGKHINPDGMEAELAEFAAIFDARKGIAVFNDLTNFLKLGDITIRENDGSFEILEVKKGNTKSNRITRQKQRMMQTVTFLNFREREEKTGKFIINTLDVRPETFCKNVSRIIEEAEWEGVGVGKIGEHLVVDCTDFLRAEELGLDMEKLMALRNPAHKLVDDWYKKGDIVQPFSPADTSEFVRNFAPLSIFPLSEGKRVKLMTNSLLLITYINPSVVLRYFEQMGWRIVKHPHEYMEEAKREDLPRLSAFVSLKKGNLTVEVPGAWFGRIGYEFLKPRSLLSFLEALLSEGSIGATASFPNFEGESMIWD